MPLLIFSFLAIHAVHLLAILHFLPILMSFLWSEASAVLFVLVRLGGCECFLKKVRFPAARNFILVCQLARSFWASFVCIMPIQLPHWRACKCQRFSNSKNQMLPNLSTAICFTTHSVARSFRRASGAFVSHGLDLQYFLAVCTTCVT